MNSNTDNQILILTPAAAGHIARCLSQHGSGAVFRLGLSTAGCSGYMYMPEVVSDLQEGDMSLTIDGVSICFPEKYASMLRGTVIDYVEGQVGMKHLVYRNPQASFECGCGESFGLVGEEPPEGEADDCRK